MPPIDPPRADEPRAEDPRTRESAPPPAPGEYVLGTSDVELARLTLQQEVWGPVTDRFLDRVGVRAGARVLDAGCGPGMLLPTLVRRVGEGGRVDAIDESSRWTEHVQRVVAARGWRNVRVTRGSIETAPLEEGAYDVIVSRWVLEFLSKPGDVIARLARALAPGGVLALEDYNHEGISLFPESEGFRAVVRATRALWASRGGDMFLAGRLPPLLRRAGLEPAEPVTTVLAGGPSSGVFRWADAFFPAHSQNMVDAGLLGREERARFLSDWAERRADRDALLFSPILVDFAATKPRTGPSTAS